MSAKREHLCEIPNPKSKIDTCGLPHCPLTIIAHVARIVKSFIDETEINADITASYQIEASEASSNSVDWPFGRI